MSHPNCNHPKKNDEFKDKQTKQQKSLMKETCLQVINDDKQVVYIENKT